jgi:hypothetical protein
MTNIFYLKGIKPNKYKKYFNIIILKVLNINFIYIKT